MVFPKNHYEPIENDCKIYEQAEQKESDRGKKIAPDNNLVLKK